MHYNKQISTKRLALLLSIIILFQSCSSYKHEQYTLLDISNKKKISKVYFTNNTKFKFKRISLEDSTYYGFAKIGSKTSNYFSEQIIDTLILFEYSNSKYAKIKLNADQVNYAKEKSPIKITLNILGITIITTIVIATATMLYHYGAFR